MPVRVVEVTLRAPGAVGGAVSREKFALIDVTGPTGNVHVVCVFEQTPFQPSNDEPPSGAALNVTDLPYPYSPEQIVPQSSFCPITRPLPVPPRFRLELNADRGRQVDLSAVSEASPRPRSARPAP